MTCWRLRSVGLVSDAVLPGGETQSSSALSSSTRKDLRASFQWICSLLWLLPRAEVDIVRAADSLELRLRFRDCSNGLEGGFSITLQRGGGGMLGSESRIRFLIGGSSSRT